MRSRREAGLRFVDQLSIPFLFDEFLFRLFKTKVESLSSEYLIFITSSGKVHDGLLLLSLSIEDLRI